MLQGPFPAIQGAGNSRTLPLIERAGRSFQIGHCIEPGLAIRTDTQSIENAYLEPVLVANLLRADMPFQ